MSQTKDKTKKPLFIVLTILLVVLYLLSIVGVVIGAIDIYKKAITDKSIWFLVVGGIIFIFITIFVAQYLSDSIWYGKQDEKELYDSLSRLSNEALNNRVPTASKKERKIIRIIQSQRPKQDFVEQIQTTQQVSVSKQNSTDPSPQKPQNIELSFTPEQAVQALQQEAVVVEQKIPVAPAFADKQTNELVNPPVVKQEIISVSDSSSNKSEKKENPSPLIIDI